MSYQQFHADVERYKASGLTLEGLNYFWWPDETDTEFRDLLKAKKKNAGSQIRTYIGLREAGEVGDLTLWMCLFSAMGEYITGFDNSFPCPPRC